MEATRAEESCDNDAADGRATEMEASESKGRETDVESSGDERLVRFVSDEDHGRQRWSRVRGG